MKIRVHYSYYRKNAGHYYMDYTDPIGELSPEIRATMLCGLILEQKKCQYLYYDILDDNDRLIKRRQFDVLTGEGFYLEPNSLSLLVDYDIVPGHTFWNWKK